MMTLEIPNELDELIQSAAARQGQDVHNFAVAALKREATNGFHDERDTATETKAARTLPESAEPGTPRHAEFLAALRQHVGKVSSGDGTLSQDTGRKFAEGVEGKRRQGRL